MHLRSVHPQKHVAMCTVHAYTDVHTHTRITTAQRNLNEQAKAVHVDPAILLRCDYAYSLGMYLFVERPPSLSKQWIVG